MTRRPGSIHEASGPAGLKRGGWTSRQARLLLMALLATGFGAVGLLTPSRAKVPSRASGAGGRIRDFSIRDAQGHRRGLADWQGRRAVVLFFLGTECPISNGYAPEMSQLSRAYGPRGIAFSGVHSDPDVTPDEAARHASEYGLEFPILMDPGQVLAAQAGVRVTPEAVVLASDGQIRYRGRIDDRYAAPGKGSGEPRTRDLQDALDAILDGRAPAVSETRAVGCPLPDPAPRSHAD